MSEPEIKPEPPNTASSKWDDSDFHPTAAPSWWQRHWRQTAMFSALAGVLLLVLFWLPKQTPVTPGDEPAPQQTAESGEDTAIESDGAAAQSSAPGKTELESPWEQAQLAKARREAQEILAKLLDRQSDLEDLHVLVWAKDDFLSAQELASEGDELYRQRQFSEAQQSYTKALDAMDQLLSSVEDRYAAVLQTGHDALDAGNAEKATESFELALQLQPDSPAATEGLARAKVLDDVNRHLLDAENFLARQQLEDAKIAATSAQDLDAKSVRAQQMLATIDQRQREQNYSSAMGEGFDHMQQQAFAEAAHSFEQAIAIKPGDDAATNALENAKRREQENKISLALSQAQSLEQQEKWELALQSYQLAQRLDASLVAARVGVLRTQVRAKLDRDLEQIIDDPLRLADSAVYAQAQELLKNANSVKPRGERIEQQAHALQQALNASTQPIAVTIQSDNQTRVTLYQIGELGTFSEQQLDLKPGHYTAVGSRDGFRDVREEFTIAPGQVQSSIIVQCTEKITFGG